MLVPSVGGYMLKKYQSYNLFHIIFQPIFRKFLTKHKARLTNSMKGG